MLHFLRYAAPRCLQCTSLRTIATSTTQSATHPVLKPASVSTTEIPKEAAAEAQKQHPTSHIHARTQHESSSKSSGLYAKVSMGVGAAVAATMTAFGFAKAQCAEQPSESGDQGLQRNKLAKRVSVTQIAANNPIEDRFNAVQLLNTPGFYSAVFDGHGGWQLAEFAKKQLHLELEAALSKEKGDISKAIKSAFDQVEAKFLEISRLSFKSGFSRAGYVGACALVAVVADNTIYCGNAGDCKAVVITRGEDGNYKAKRLSKSYSSNKLSEQERLKKQFPGEDDIVVCRSKNACYVKGKLMPTRALGDYRLKHADFNFHEFTPDQGYRAPIKTYTGPYITHEADIITHQLRPEDEFVVMASDGLWDELTKPDISGIVKEILAKGGNKQNIAEELMERSLQHAAKDNNLTKEDMLAISLGKRRHYHDDITILVIDLRGQFRNN